MPPAATAEAPAATKPVRQANQPAASALPPAVQAAKNLPADAAPAAVYEALAAAAVTAPAIADPAAPAPAVVAPPPPASPPPPRKRQRWIFHAQSQQKVPYNVDLLNEGGWVEVDDAGNVMVAVIDKSGVIAYSANPQFDTDVPIDVVAMVELANRDGLRAWLFGAGIYEIPGPQGVVTAVRKAEYHDLRVAVIALELRREQAARDKRVADAAAKG